MSAPAGPKAAALFLLALLAAHAFAPAPARASYEEFATFDVARMEEDDESALDHYLARQPDAWREEWELARNGFRTGQGCLTSGQWNIDHELKTTSPMGERAVLDLQLRQVNSDVQSYQWLSLLFRYPTPIGEFGWRFRPDYDKSRQDFALLWMHGDSRSPLQAEIAFTVEDMFNSLWEFRQARVGNHNEPYRAHPFEPSLRIVSRGNNHRYSLDGAWQTPSRRAIRDGDPAVNGSQTLWGSRLLAEGEQTFSRWSAVGRLEGQQALTSHTVDAVPGNARTYRRMWSAELAVRRQLDDRTLAEVRWMYRGRAQSWAPPVADARLDAIDRMSGLEVSRRLSDGWRIRTGLLHDRVGIAVHGGYPGFTWGTRTESRAFVGLQARFGKVSIQGIECIELDKEPYEVTLHHDKGFFHLQTSF